MPAFPDPRCHQYYEVEQQLLNLKPGGPLPPPLGLALLPLTCFSQGFLGRVGLRPAEQAFGRFRLGLDHFRLQQGPFIFCFPGANQYSSPLFLPVQTRCQKITLHFCMAFLVVRYLIGRGPLLPSLHPVVSALRREGETYPFAGTGPPERFSGFLQKWIQSGGRKDGPERPLLSLCPDGQGSRFPGAGHHAYQLLVPSQGTQHNRPSVLEPRAPPSISHGAELCRTCVGCGRARSPASDTHARTRADACRADPRHFHDSGRNCAVRYRSILIHSTLG